LSPVAGTLRRLRTLADDLREAARLGDLPALDRILAQRRTLLDRLERADDGEDARSRADLLVSILETDREAEEILKKRLADLGAELVALERGRRGLRAYAGAAGRSSKWIDERG
jgi:hypothetical protein